MVLMPWARGRRLFIPADAQAIADDLVDLSRFIGSSMAFDDELFDAVVPLS